MKEQQRVSKRGMQILSIISLIVMGYVDYATGYELILSFAYLVPVWLCAWYLGRAPAIWMSAASGIASFLADKFSGHAYSHGAIIFWNSFTCLVISLTTGLILDRLKRTLEAQKRANEELAAALKNLERSTHEIRRLQDGLQVVCAWTKRIKVGDQWMTPDDFLTTQLHLTLSHGMSPEARAEFERDIERQPRA